MTAQPKHTEARFEDAIEFALLARGYVRGDPQLFDAEHAIFPKDVVAYIKASQHKQRRRNDIA
jgi:type I restriction enzyme R subunit